MPVRYRLRQDPPAPAVPLVLDAAQERVAAHAHGPLLVLAGPGTGKTATLVEAVARRVEAGADPASLLVLTFSRRAAAELRERLAVRLGAHAVAPAAWTFHALCLALLTEQRAIDDPTGPRPHVVGGPEQEAVIRELLRGDRADHRPWPAPLDEVLDTRGLAAEVRAFVARAQLVGLDPAGLDALGRGSGRADWQAVAGFYDRYLGVLEAQSLLDYAELVARAATVAARPDVLARLRARYAAVWVDEYQDTDPAQEALLAAIAGDGRDLVVVGDPDQAIYAFRGATVDGILEFTDRFRTAAGTPAPYVALQVCRRSGPGLVELGRRLADPIPTPGLAVDARRAHRDLHAQAGVQPGSAQVLLFPSPGAEAEAVADLLRRAHLDDGLPWQNMAVLVRSGMRSIPLLRRVLGMAGVPVEVAGDELPLAAEPAVAALLLVLRCAEDASLLTDERAGELLVSPLVAADAQDLRRLGRMLRDRARLADAKKLPASSATLIRQTVVHPELLAGLGASVAGPAQRLAGLLGAARDVLSGGGSAEEALWAVWETSPWRQRLVAAAGGRGSDARAADRDLDAVLALFTALARAVEEHPGAGLTRVLDTVEAQQIPAAAADERSALRPGVRLLTAHRSKGLEWDLVVVAGVQEGGWPDLRPRGSLLEPDRLAAGAVEAPPVSAEVLLADERRLFYVACTRARERLVVTAVDAAADDGTRPSRFLAATGVPARYEARRPVRPRTLAGLVAALRSDAVDPARSPARRAAATARLAMLAAATGSDGVALVPAAHPDRWWGLTPRTAGTGYDTEAPLPLSSSTLTALDECPLRWYLSHEVHADGAASTALAFGRVIHALADLVANGTLPNEPAALDAELDKVWSALGYESQWQAANERRAAAAAIGRLAAAVSAPGARTLVGSELAFDEIIDVAGGPVRVRGRMDRVEIDVSGHVVVVDLKTGKSTPSGPQVVANPQLRLYQYVVEEGLVDPERVGVAPLSGGAELWQLRSDGEAGPTGTPPLILVQPAVHDPSEILEQLAAGRAIVVEERFGPTPGDRCTNCQFRGCCPAQADGGSVVA